MKPVHPVIASPSASGGAVANAKTLPESYVDPKQPGIVRFKGADAFDGMLAGTRATAVSHRLNAYPKLVDGVQPVVRWLRSIPTRSRSEQIHLERLEAILRDIGELAP